MTPEQKLSELARQIQLEKVYGTPYIYTFDQLDAIARTRAWRDFKGPDPYEREMDFSQTRFFADGTIAEPRWN